MSTLPTNVESTLATLRERWGGAAPRWGGEVLGSLAMAPLVVPAVDPETPPDLDRGPGSGMPALLDRATPTGFRALDSILGLGGLPRAATTALHGDGTSGKTTLALKAVAQAQAAGGIAAYLDLARSLDPVEAVARGVQLDWLVVLTPDSLEQALAMAAMLLQDRTVDLLLLDLQSRARDGSGLPASTLAERFGRLAALARKAGVQLLVLEPPSMPSVLAGALTQVAALRLELSRRAWIRLGRDVVGQRTEVRVVRDRFGPPGLATELRILYADGGLRDVCLAKGELMWETEPEATGRSFDRSEGRPRVVPARVVPARYARARVVSGASSGGVAGAGGARAWIGPQEIAPPGGVPPRAIPAGVVPAAVAPRAIPAGAAPPGGVRLKALTAAARPSPPLHLTAIPVPADATPSSLLAPPSPPPGPQPSFRAIRGGAYRSGRQAVDGRPGSGREPLGARAGGAARDAAGGGPQARP
jgi:recA bacterial DNA recombination protein